MRGFGVKGNCGVFIETARSHNVLRLCFPEERLSAQMPKSRVSGTGPQSVYLMSRRIVVQVLVKDRYLSLPFVGDDRKRYRHHLCDVVVSRSRVMLLVSTQRLAPDFGFWDDLYYCFHDAPC
jgi:hypothetical protein